MFQALIRGARILIEYLAISLKLIEEELISLRTTRSPVELDNVVTSLQQLIELK